MSVFAAAPVSVSVSAPVLLITTVVADHHLQQIAAALPALELVYAPTAGATQAAILQHAARVQVVLTIGSIGLSAAQMDALPALQLVCALGAGYEKVDVAHARSRGIATGNGAGTNDSCVADHALGLVLASVRGIKDLDAATRAGVWRTALPLPAGLTGKRLGVLGLGTIGRKIALRAQAFEMEVGYHNRSPRSDVPWTYFDSLAALAAWADVLVIATPGGADTQHLVDAGVLRALGPHGHLVNIARGSVVDTEALAQALRSGELGAAALDVYDSEPQPPVALLDAPHVLLTPHVAGWSPESVQATVDRFIANARCHLEGRPLVSPV